MTIVTAQPVLTTLRYPSRALAPALTVAFTPRASLPGHYPHLALARNTDVGTTTTRRLQPRDR